MNHLAQTIKALSDPIRLRVILLLLSGGELCVCDLMAVLNLPQSTVSRHLAYLKRSCWVNTRREGLWIYYTITDQPCRFCTGTLLLLEQELASLPEAQADQEALIRYRAKNSSLCS